MSRPNTQINYPQFIKRLDSMCGLADPGRYAHISAQTQHVKMLTPDKWQLVVTPPARFLREYRLSARVRLFQTWELLCKRENAVAAALKLLGDAAEERAILRQIEDDGRLSPKTHQWLDKTENELTYYTIQAHEATRALLATLPHYKKTAARLTLCRWGDNPSDDKLLALVQKGGTGSHGEILAAVAAVETPLQRLADMLQGIVDEEGKSQRQRAAFDASVPPAEPEQRRPRGQIPKNCLKTAYVELMKLFRPLCGSANKADEHTTALLYFAGVIDDPDSRWYYRKYHSFLAQQ